MATPCFDDLGRSAKDVFFKNYFFGLVKLDVKTKTPCGIEFNVNGNSNIDTEVLFANFEAKQVLHEYNTTLKHKWNTDNTLTNEITIDQHFAKGLKVCFRNTFVPSSGKKSASFNSSYNVDNLHLNADVDFNHAGATFHGAGVINYQGYLAGSKLSFDLKNNKLIKSNFAVGYKAPEFALHANLSDGNDYFCSVYHKNNPKLETGISVAWSSVNNTSRLGVGCVYKIDSDTFIRAKINNDSKIGLGFSHKLRPGITLHLCSLLDAKNLNQGAHKLGLGLDFQA